MNLKSLGVASAFIMLAMNVLGADGADNASSPKRMAADDARVWYVGPTRRYKHLRHVAKKAQDGDTVAIDAGVYPNDYATWRQNNLTLRGIGGLAHLKSEGLIPNGKAIWVIDGDNVHIENIEFSGAAVRHTNGAGIRHQGGKLTLSNTFFHDNEFSILSGQLPQTDIVIRNSRFWHQKRPVRHSHGVYIGATRSLTLVGNHFTGTDKGHHVKSRAFANLIAYNRIEDVEGGTSSRLIDLSNCGFSIVLGNQLHQTVTTENSNAIGYGPEGCDGRTERQKRLFVINNTFINEATGGDFVRNFSGGEVLVGNNVIFGAGRNLSGPGIDVNNVRLSVRAVPDKRWGPINDPEVLDSARDFSDIEAGALVPDSIYMEPVGVRDRIRDGSLDVGAVEAG